MKKLIAILSLTAGLMSLTGCSDYLDSDYIFDERMSIEDVFHNKDYTNNWLARSYAFLAMKMGYMVRVRGFGRMRIRAFVRYLFS